MPIAVAPVPTPMRASFIIENMMRMPSCGAPIR
jgi:hypothetical protein